MFRTGSKRRFMDRAARSNTGATSAPASTNSPLVSGMKSRPAVVEVDGQGRSANVRTSLTAAGFGSGGGGGFGNGGSNGSGFGGFGSGGFGGSDSQVDHYNPIHDDLSRGTVAEDWIPTDPAMQNRMFRIMYNRGQVEGPAVEMISDLTWSDFDIAGIKDPVIIDTYMAAKEATKIEQLMPFVTTEYLVTGKAVVQFLMNSKLGIWADAVLHSSDYLYVEEIPRTGFMPMVDLVPSLATQMWAKSTDERAVASHQGLSPEFLQQMASGEPVPLDPEITAYIPRRSSWDDVMGTSWYVRNITLWAMEKSLINATLVGHRRRAGPITQIAVGSEQREPTAEQIDAVVAAHVAAEEDSVSSTIGTRYDVQFNQIRGSLAEMWKWEDSAQFLLEAKMRAFGISEQMLMGEVNIDTSIAPTIFMERLKAHRKYMTEVVLMQKFFRGLATVHNFRRRSEAELSHRIIINDEDHELQLPTVVWHKSLDTTADMQRADLLDKMEEVGLPVTQEEWCRTLGGGEIRDRLRSAVADLEMRLEYMKLSKISQEVRELQEAPGDFEDLDERIEKLQKEIKDARITEDDDGYDINRMTRSERRDARDMADGVLASLQETDPSRVHTSSNNKITGNGSVDLQADSTQLNRDVNTLSTVGKAC